MRLLLLGSTARRSPLPRPGMLPPTLNGSGAAVQLLPWSVLLSMAPLFGFHELVYPPTAAYTVLAFWGSRATERTPEYPQLLQFTQSSNGVQLAPPLVLLYSPPISVRAYTRPCTLGW